RVAGSDDTAAVSGECGVGDAVLVASQGFELRARVDVPDPCRVIRGETLPVFRARRLDDVVRACRQDAGAIRGKLRVREMRLVARERPDECAIGQVPDT